MYSHGRTTVVFFRHTLLAAALKMPRTKSVPRRCEGGAAREPRRAAAAALDAAPAPASDPNVPPPGPMASGPSEVTLKLEEVEGPRRDGAAPGPAQLLAAGPRAAVASAPAPAPHHDAPAAEGAGASGATLVKEEEAEEEEEEETLGQQRDRLALARVHGPVRVDAHIKVEDTDEEDADVYGEGAGELESGGEGGDGQEEEGTGGEVGLVLLAGAAHVPEEDGGEGGAPRRSMPADRAARAKRGRGDVAAGDVVRDAPAPKRQTGGAGAQVGQSGCHGVYELTGRHIRKTTPWLTWRAELNLSRRSNLRVGHFATVDDAARAYDVEVQRRGWAHVRPLNFPQPEELAAYARAEERCDERGLPLSLAPDPPSNAQGAGAAQGAAGQRPPKPSPQKPGKSGFFGVIEHENKTTPWRAEMKAPGTKKNYVVGYCAITEDAARAYDAEIRRRGWTHLKRLNFPDPADAGALLPSSATVAPPGPE